MSETILRITSEELCQSKHITHELVVEVVDYGIVEPILGSGQDDWIFDPASAHWLKKAIRLYHELEIDWVAVAMVIELLKQKESLEAQNELLQRRLQRFS
jgi:chaperone modulatory protein CbpM